MARLCIDRESSSHITFFADAHHGNRSWMSGHNTWDYGGRTIFIVCNGDFAAPRLRQPWLVAVELLSSVLLWTPAWL